MLRILFLLTAVLYGQFAQSQLTVNGTINPTNLVQNYLVGAGVTVSNVTFNGMPGTSTDPQIGFFDATGTNLGIDSGLVMCSGLINNAIGPNNQSGITQSWGAFSADPDLNAISSVNIYDAAILEFDIIPTGDTIQFKYSFASEEYMEYVGGGINDAFGIFLSGTGISGPYSSGAVNIALIPGTAIPVTIDNVNAFTNAAYYVDNGDGFTAPFSTSNTYIQYDGRTVTLTAKYPVQCGGSYHLKFAIGDGADGLLDSGVFIEAGSLTSSGVQVSLQTPVGFFTNVPGVVYEDCAIGSDVDFIFVRPDSAAGDTVFFNIGGNAINGTDYTTIANNYVVFSGSDTAILTISAIGDGLTEGIDTLWITVPISNSGPCSLIYDTVYLYISDPYEVIPYAGPDTIYYCPGQIFDFIGSVNVGVPPYNYTWANGTSGSSVSYTITQLGSDTLILDVSDACGFIGSDTVYFSQQAPPPILINAGPDTTLTCAGQSVTLTGLSSGGVAPLYQYWSNLNPTMTVQPLVTTTYVLTAVDDCLNEAYDSLTVFVPPYDPYVLVTSDTLATVTCLGDPATVFGYPTSGGFAPYDYSWSTGSQDSLINVTIISNGANYYLTITDACGLDTTLHFVYSTNQTPIDFLLSSVRQCRNEDSTALLSYTISGGAQPYVFQDVSLPAGISGYVWDTISQSVLVQMAQEGVYTFEVTDQCGTTAVDSASLVLNTCSISTPNVITPNGDGVNDLLVFDGLQYHPNSELYVYDRWGVQVYADTDYQNNWDGGGLTNGLYYYVLILNDGTIPGQFYGHINIFY